MAAAGLTGEGLKQSSGRKPGAGPKQGKLQLADNRVLEGLIVSEDDFSAQILTGDGKFHLLAREAGRLREKPIEPKSDWTSYNGSLSGNRFSPLEQINTANVKRLALAWLFPIPNGQRLEATPIVVDGVRDRLE
jgi:alcohol dehydrogenase (cytochrome c)